MKDSSHPKCATVIPMDWPKFASPTSTGHVTADRRAWFAHLVELNKLHPSPRVYRGAR